MGEDHLHDGAVGASYSIQTYDKSTDSWTTIADTPGLMPKRLLVDADDYLWIIDTAYQVYSHTGSEWIKHEANAIDIAYDTDGGLYQLTP